VYLYQLRSLQLDCVRFQCKADVPPIGPIEEVSNFGFILVVMNLHLDSTSALFSSSLCVEWGQWARVLTCLNTLGHIFVLCSFCHIRRSSLVGGLGAGLRSNARRFADVAFGEISLS
jgi:hypothetical protein